MNEITRIHLARVPYEIDVAAKKDLEKYLTAIRKSLGEEIDAMEDIEIRMTEILAPRGVVRDSVITENDVKAIREQLGEPIDFSSDDADTDSSRHTSETGPRKFYRDPDSGILGGVIAGFAAYTGWDVTILRILAVVLTIFPGWGTPILIYIVIWIVAPPAETASEKLEMRGEAVNIDSIKEQTKKVVDNAAYVAQDAADNVAIAAKDVTEKVKNNFSSDATKMKRTNRVKPALHGIMAFVGIILLIGFIPTLVAYIFFMAIAIVTVIPIEIVAKPLFLTTIFSTLAFVFVLLVSIVGLLVGMVRAKFDRTFLASLIVMFVLLIGAAVSGGVWLSTAGEDGVNQVNEILQNKLNVDIEGREERVRVEVGPIKISVND